jgi:hypothetical protein
MSQVDSSTSQYLYFVCFCSTAYSCRIACRIASKRDTPFSQICTLQRPRVKAFRSSDLSVGCLVERPLAATALDLLPMWIYGGDLVVGRAHCVARGLFGNGIELEWVVNQ